MPVATAMASANAQPFEIVICTIDGPVTLDARDLGIDVQQGVPRPQPPRSGCDLDMQAGAALADNAGPTPLAVPVSYADTRTVRPRTGATPAAPAPVNRASPPRAPPPAS